MRMVSQVEVLISGYESPEGPAFDRDGNLFFVNWLASSIVKLTPDGQASEFFNTGGIPAGLAFHPDGSLYVADEGDQIHGIMRITPHGEGSIVVNEYQGSPLNGANDLVFDPNGVLYFSDPWGSAADNPVGGFYRLFPDGTLEQIDTGLAFPNGVALTADGTAVILAETYRNRLLRYPIRPDGSIGPREHWADTHLPPGPDGMAFDANGDLYVAHFSAGCVDIFDPTGARVDQIAVPGEKPTNLAFAPDGATLVITEVATASLYQVRLNVAGQRLHDGR
ncbi:MAG: gluconolactonase [Thermomicrobiales bacterium]|nr:gluconolactonase [Thermomicrobiales bacterium]